MNHGYAIASLVCGVAGIVCCLCVTGIPAIILGRIARRKIAESGGRFVGLTLARWGIILGWISIPLTILTILLVVAILVLFGIEAGHRLPNQP
jgi:hypothetical protein